jgi:OOP family OmpA-OmpF porin
MAKIRRGHLVMGAGLVVMGYAVLIIAVGRQAERNGEAASRGPMLACTGETTAGIAPTAKPSATDPIPPPSAPSSAESGALLPAESAASASAVEPARQEGHLFKFNPGGAAMGREEVARLFAMGTMLSHNPTVKVSIEGYGDLPGDSPLTVGIARHRAKVGQTLLKKVGVAEDRVTLSSADVATDPKLARMIRITTTPLLPEAEKP